jgi:hypothetical protein
MRETSRDEESVVKRVSGERETVTMIQTRRRGRRAARAGGIVFYIDSLSAGCFVPRRTRGTRHLHDTATWHGERRNGRKIMAKYLSCRVATSQFDDLEKGEIEGVDLKHDEVWLAEI